MNILRASLVVLACCTVPVAFAQWQWIDPGGRKVYSDQPPPPGTPAAKILKTPGNRPVEPDPEPAAAAPAHAAPSPKVSGRDQALEERRKAASAAEAEKKKQREEQLAKDKAENCAQAKRAKATLDSGVRLTQVNAKGETEILDDSQRAAEGRRLDAAIAANCGT